MDTYIQLCLKWITSKDLLYSTWSSAQCCVTAWMGGEFGGEWVHVFVWWSFSTVYLKLLHCFSTQYKINNFKRKENKC